VTLYNGLLSYHELTQAPAQSWPRSALVFGALKSFDLPDCYRALKDKRLTLISPWDSQQEVWDGDALRAHKKALGLTGVKVRWEGA
jgi:hypothetical protein